MFGQACSLDKVLLQSVPSSQDWRRRADLGLLSRMGSTDLHRHGAFLHHRAEIPQEPGHGHGGVWGNVKHGAHSQVNGPHWENGWLVWNGSVLCGLYLNSAPLPWCSCSWCEKFWCWHLAVYVSLADGVLRPFLHLDGARLRRVFHPCKRFPTWRGPVSGLPCSRAVPTCVHARMRIEGNAERLPFLGPGEDVKHPLFATQLEKICYPVGPQFFSS